MSLSILPRSLKPKNQATDASNTGANKGFFEADYPEFNGIRTKHDDMSSDPISSKKKEDKPIRKTKNSDKRKRLLGKEKKQIIQKFKRYMKENMIIDNDHFRSTS